MTDSGALDRLATLAGIEPAYYDIWGNYHPAPPETKRTLLEAMGMPAATDADVAASLAELEDAAWRRALPPVLVVRVGRPLVVPVALPAAAVHGTLEAEISEETGAVHQHTLRPAEAPLEQSRRVGTTDHERRHVHVPVDLPAGYHAVRLPAIDTKAMRLIVVPEACYLPDGHAGARAWGFTTHVYSLRSPRNWGIGDLTDLAELASGAGAMGAAAVGINPLHALYPAEPARASPYSPSTRLFLNPLYIDVESVPEFAASARARQVAAVIAPALDMLRSAAFIDYNTVASLKTMVLRLVFAEFQRSEGGRRVHAERAAAFATFREEGGVRLQRFAEFEALSETFAGRPWTQWPEAFRDPTAPAVRAFVEAQADLVDFHVYLQWLADEQLAAAQARAKANGMTIGLYRDLAVGVDAGGSDGWSDQDVVVTGAAVGAPPDAFNMKGQNWGMPPLAPRALRDNAYEPFIAMVRANMRHAGALRIDHAMGLMHLFCIPDGEPAAHGAYLEYPFEDLLGIIALESQRERCVVIGEDLGTVPDGFRDRMAAANILSYRVLYFEKDGERFKRPHEYPALALACVTTHDLATLVGFWTGADIDLRKRLDLYPSPEVERNERDARRHDRHQMIDALTAEGLLDGAEYERREKLEVMAPELIAAIHGYLAKSPARYVMVQLDDIALEQEQVNLPGTVDENPNWRRRLSQDLDDLLASPVMAAVRETMSERSHSSGGTRGG